MTEAESEWHFCPFGDDGKGAGCIVLIRIGEPHSGPHRVVRGDEDDY
jgi:hypothetical protein